MVALVEFYQRQLAEAGLADHSRAWLAGWVVKGVVLPVLAWVLINAGSTPLIPPIVHITPPRGITPFRWEVLYLFTQTMPALAAIGFCWAAVGLTGLAATAFGRASDRESGVVVAAGLALLVAPVTGFVGNRYGWGLATTGLLAWAWPLARFALTLPPARDRVPRYAQAIANLKRGRYADAELAIVGELEKCETDFDGWMMLAELYAGQFRDLDEAERTVIQLCDEPATSQPQISIALHRLADWELKLRGDPVAASRVLEEICRRMPGTHLARMARLRIEQLPKTRAELDEQVHARKLSLPALSENPVEPATTGHRDALEQANQLVKSLQADPNDVPAREKLAGIFAGQLGQVNLAVEQIELLLEIPGQPERKLAEWLALLASWQIKRGNEQTAREILERIVHEHPQSPQAFAAQRRISLMNMEARARRPFAQARERPAVS